MNKKNIKKLLLLTTMLGLGGTAYSQSYMCIPCPEGSWSDGTTGECRKHIEEKISITGCHTFDLPNGKYQISLSGAGGGKGADGSDCSVWGLNNQAGYTTFYGGHGGKGYVGELKVFEIDLSQPETVTACLGQVGGNSGGGGGSIFKYSGDTIQVLGGGGGGGGSSASCIMYNSSGSNGGNANAYGGGTSNGGGGGYGNGGGAYGGKGYGNSNGNNPSRENNFWGSFSPGKNANNAINPGGGSSVDGYVVIKEISSHF